MCKYVKLGIAVVSVGLAFVNPAFLGLYLLFITGCPVVAGLLGYECCGNKEGCKDGFCNKKDACKNECLASCNDKTCLEKCNKACGSACSKETKDTQEIVELV